MATLFLWQSDKPNAVILNSYFLHPFTVDFFCLENNNMFYEFAYNLAIKVVYLRIGLYQFQERINAERLFVIIGDELLDFLNSSL